VPKLSKIGVHENNEEGLERTEKPVGDRNRYVTARLRLAAIGDWSLVN
jgi:hypothetical protein